MTILQLPARFRSPHGHDSRLLRANTHISCPIWPPIWIGSMAIPNPHTSHIRASLLLMFVDLTIGSCVGGGLRLEVVLDAKSSRSTAPRRLLATKLVESPWNGA